MTTIFKKHSSKLVLLLLSVTIFNACHKNAVLGTTTVCPSSAFKVRTQFSISKTSVNPKTDTLKIVAGFTEPIEWWVTITGKTSGATKSYTGKTDSLNIYYFGNSETDIFFQAEDCDVKFELACGYSGVTKTFTYTSVPRLTKNNFGVLLNDFDGNGSYPAHLIWPNPQTSVRVSTILNILTDASPQGGNSMLYSGVLLDSMYVIAKQDSVINPLKATWYYGGFDYTISTSFFENTLKLTSPDSVYLNMYIYGYNSTIPNTQLQLYLLGLTVPTETGSPAENKNYNLNIDWDGWKMVSLKLSEFNLDMHSYTSIHGINALGIDLAAGPLQNTASKCKIDFIFLSAYAPYKEVVKRNY